MASNWKSILGTVAPGLATALGGPLAGLAVKAIGSALGLPEASSDDQVAQAVVGATPDQLLSLKTADQAFKVKMRELDVDLERIAMQDRSSARSTYVSTRDKVVPMLAFIIVGAFIATTVGVLFFQVKVEAALAGALIGYLSAKAEQVVAFYFGSSAGSKGKDETLAAAMRK